eukprot:359750-Chlamydomonas_euryale.AAC.1
MPASALRLCTVTTSGEAPAGVTARAPPAARRRTALVRHLHTHTLNNLAIKQIHTTLVRRTHHGDQAHAPRQSGAQTTLIRQTHTQPIRHTSLPFNRSRLWPREPPAREHEFDALLV